MAEEGSVSLRPRGFTPYHSFIINLHHAGPAEGESCNRPDLCSSHSPANMGGAFSLLLLKKGGGGGNDTERIFVHLLICFCLSCLRFPPCWPYVKRGSDTGVEAYFHFYFLNASVYQ